jgi:phosphoglycerate dehydrogenase-like enzyme
MPSALIPALTVFPDDSPCARLLREAGFEIRRPRHPDFSRGVCGDEQTIAELQGTEAVVAWAEAYPACVIEALPKLRVISRAGVGFDKVDVGAATRRQIAVTITPNSNFDCVAEHALSLMFAIARSTLAHDRGVRDGRWARLRMAPLRDMTLGILGLGRIGKSLATRAAALRMNLLATEAYPDYEFARRHDLQFVDLDTLLAQSDYLSLHCPLNDQTRGLVNRQFMAKMKPSAVLINTARGGLVVERDLVEALTTRRLGAAGLDVFEHEPATADNPLMALDNVVLTPHVGGGDWRSIEDMGVEAAQNIIELARGHWPEGNVVNSEIRSGWSWEC